MLRWVGVDGDGWRWFRWNGFYSNRWYFGSLSFQWVWEGRWKNINSCAAFFNKVNSVNFITSKNSGWLVCWLLIQNVVGTQPWYSSFEPPTADTSLLQRIKFSGWMSRSLRCLGPARQMLVPILRKMGNILKLNETLGGIAVSVGFKSPRISSEHLVHVSNEGLCTVRVLFFFAAYSSKVIGYIAVETVFSPCRTFWSVIASWSMVGCTSTARAWILWFGWAILVLAAKFADA